MVEVVLGLLWGIFISAAVLLWGRYRGNKDGCGEHHFGDGTPRLRWKATMEETYHDAELVVQQQYRYSCQHGGCKKAEYRWEKECVFDEPTDFGQMMEWYNDE
jgi:hypothetical protein